MSFSNKMRYVITLKFLGILCILVGYILVFVTGFSNEISNMNLPWGKNAYFSTSGALRFCKKEVVVPLFVSGALFLCAYFFSVHRTREAIINSTLLTCGLSMLTLMMFETYTVGCSADMADIPTCCDTSITGECTREKLKIQFKHLHDDDLKLPVCTNGPTCTKKRNNTMQKRHVIITLIGTICFLVLLIYNYHGRPVEKKIITAYAITLVSLSIVSHKNHSILFETIEVIVFIFLVMGLTQI